MKSAQKKMKCSVNNKAKIIIIIATKNESNLFYEIYVIFYHIMMTRFAPITKINCLISEKKSTTELTK